VASHVRILLKLSGEMMGGSDGKGLDSDSIGAVAGEVCSAVRAGLQVAVVIGAGNLVRGAGPNRLNLDIEQQRLDTMGMLATAVNCTALADQLGKAGIEAVHMTTFSTIPFARPIAADEAVRHLEAGRVVLFSGGTGLPFFSTDTAAVVRALEVGADTLFKGTQVDGVYDGDPEGDVHVKFLPRVPYSLALEKQLKFMDLSAIALASQRGLKVVVYNAHQQGNLGKAIAGKLVCSQVGP